MIIAKHMSYLEINEEYEHLNPFLIDNGNEPIA